MGGVGLGKAGKGGCGEWADLVALAVGTADVVAALDCARVDRVTRASEVAGGAPVDAPLAPDRVQTPTVGGAVSAGAADVEAPTATWAREDLVTRAYEATGRGPLGTPPAPDRVRTPTKGGDGGRASVDAGSSGPTLRDKRRLTFFSLFNLDAPEVF